MNRRWTPDDDTRLIALARHYIDVDTIAADLDRTRRAVQGRIDILRAAGRLSTPPALAYRPHDGDRVPCAVCGIRFTRTRVTARYCSEDCVNCSKRIEDPVHRRDGICPRCGVNPRPPRASGTGLRGWCRPCESAQKTEYMRTDAGKATMRRYLASDKGQAARQRSRERAGHV